MQHDNEIGEKKSRWIAEDEKRVQNQEVEWKKDLDGNRSEGGSIKRSSLRDPVKNGEGSFSGKLQGDYLGAQKGGEISRKKRSLNQVLFRVKSMSWWSLVRAGRDMPRKELYLVAGIFSVILDVFTVFIAAVQALIVTGASLAGPFAGLVIWVGLHVTDKLSNPLILLMEIVIATLYLLAGHFAKKRWFLSIIAVLGFDVLDFLEVVNVFPWAIVSAFVNYQIALLHHVTKKMMEGEID